MLQTIKWRRGHNAYQLSVTILNKIDRRPYALIHTLMTFMRKIILSLITSFDGFIEGPNREIDWITFDEETGKALNKFLSEIDTVLYGRVSYESWGSYTPPEDSVDFEKDFYKRLHKMKKYVFSLSKNKFEGNPVVINSDINGAMERLKREPGKDIWLYGGSGLVSTFMN